MFSFRYSRFDITHTHAHMHAHRKRSALFFSLSRFVSYGNEYRAVCVRVCVCIDISIGSVSRACLLCICAFHVSVAFIRVRVRMYTCVRVYLFVHICAYLMSTLKRNLSFVAGIKVEHTANVERQRKRDDPPTKSGNKRRERERARAH